MFDILAAPEKPLTAYPLPQKNPTHFIFPYYTFPIIISVWLPQPPHISSFPFSPPRQTVPQGPIIWFSDVFIPMSHSICNITTTIILCVCVLSQCLACPTMPTNKNFLLFYTHPKQKTGDKTTFFWQLFIVCPSRLKNFTLQACLNNENNEIMMW